MAKGHIASCFFSIMNKQFSKNTETKETLLSSKKPNTIIVKL